MLALTRFAIYRPVATVMGCLIVALLGLVAVARLPMDLMPDVTLPVVSVTTIYEGAAPEEIETVITRPLEQTLGSVQGVKKLASTSLEGSSVVRVQFEWGTNLDSAISDMRARVERVRQFLPEDIETPYIRRFDVADLPFIFLGLNSTLEPVEVTRYAEKNIVPQLERIEGVASVSVRGGVRREIQVELDRGKLQTMNLGVGEVVAALQRENVNQPAGYYKAGNLKLLIRSQGEYRNLQEIADTVIRQQDGALVRLSDVAEIVDGHEEITEQTRINGNPGVMIYVYKQSGANTVATSDAVHKAIAQINPQIAHGDLTVRVDNADFIRNSIANIKVSALYGMGLAVIVLIVFLRSLRSTLVIGVTMPLSILATFILIYFQGFTLNIVSFGGLALGIGLLVDNSIVVLESIVRKREEGLDSKQAALEGTREVASAIVASTATTLIVFLPLLFITGMTGILLNQLAWVVSFSLLCSLLASLTLTPMVSAYWLGSVGRQSVSRSVPVRIAAAFSNAGRMVFDGIESVYALLLGQCLRFGGITALLLLVTFAAIVSWYPLVGTEFLPKTDEGRIYVMGRMAAGIQLETLTRQAMTIEDVAMTNVPEMRTTASFIGDGPSEADDWNECRVIVQLVPKDQRERSSIDVQKALATQLQGLAGMKLNVRASTEMMIFRMLSRRAGSGSDIEVEVRGHDLDTAEQLASAVAEVMKQTPGLANVEVQLDERRPELVTEIDRLKASKLGISVADVTQTLETTVRGTQATVYRDDGDEFNIRVSLQETDRERRSDVEQVGIATGGGRVVALKNLVGFQSTDVPISIGRRDQQRFVAITADCVDRDMGSAVTDLQSRLAGLPRPANFTFNIAGDWEQQQESFQSLRLGFILAILLMYMIMAAQFESFYQPLLILISIPLGAIGVVIVLLTTETTLNVQSFIGIVMLAGIVVNNAIVLVDYVNQLRLAEPTAPIRDLVVQASRRRFRPILMTTLTTVLAMLPLALGWGEGGELQAPMARVVIGGLLSGTLITLVAIPLACQAFGQKVIVVDDIATDE